MPPRYARTRLSLAMGSPAVSLCHHPRAGVCRGVLFPRAGATSFTPQHSTCLCGGQILPSPPLRLLSTTTSTLSELPCHFQV